MTTERGDELIEDCTPALKGERSYMPRSSTGVRTFQIRSQNGHIDDRTRAAEVISQTLRRHFKHERGKQPATVVQFVEV